jgi:hypothetical protein
VSEWSEQRVIALLERLVAGQQAQLVALHSIDANLAEFLTDWLAANTEPQAVTAHLARGEPVALTVDSTNQTLTLTFDDDHGDPTAAPPGDGSGIAVTFASDATSVVDVGAATATADGFTAPLTIGTEGTANLSATVANTSGAPLTDADGTTAFVQPTPLNVTVAPGQTVSATLSEG